MGELTDRALLEEIAEGIRHLEAVLTEAAPLLELGKALTNGGPPAGIRAAGMRRALRNGRVTDAR